LRKGATVDEFDELVDEFDELVNELVKGETR
jgi:hypothetical protein